MSSALQAFLNLTELDELYNARQTLGQPEAEDRLTLETVLTQWQPAQAVANLLFYPELIPDPLRFQALLKALDEPSRYAALAATVGLARLKRSMFSTEQQAQLAERLILQVRTGGRLIASRAAMALGHYLGRAEATQLIALFDQPDAAVRHNLLTALIQLVGLNHIQGVLQSALASSQLSPAARAFVQESQASLAPFFHGDTADTQGFITSPLGVPLLAYLPNLNDYHAASSSLL